MFVTHNKKYSIDSLESFSNILINEIIKIITKSSIIFSEMFLVAIDWCINNIEIDYTTTLIKIL